MRSVGVRRVPWSDLWSPRIEATDPLASLPMLDAAVRAFEGVCEITTARVTVGEHDPARRGEGSGVEERVDAPLVEGVRRLVTQRGGPFARPSWIVVDPEGAWARVWGGPLRVAGRPVPYTVDPRGEGVSWSHHGGPVALRLVNWCVRVQLGWTVVWSPWASDAPDREATAWSGALDRLRTSGWGPFG